MKNAIVCPACKLVQFTLLTGNCRRCNTCLFTLVEIPLTHEAIIGGSLPFGRSVKSIRQVQSRSQNSVGYQAGVARSHLSRIESGTATPTVRTITRLLSALGADAVIVRIKTPQPPKRRATIQTFKTERKIARKPTCNQMVDA